jgi:hypothetical protein
MTQPAIATFVRRRTLGQRIALLLLVVVLADFSAPDGCDCGPNDLTRAVSIGVHR